MWSEPSFRFFLRHLIRFYRNLAKVIEEFDPLTIKPFPPLDGSRFARIVDEAMGFI